ncbi:MAG: FAD-dependent oxidoreductase, partial [Erysipelotrichaceae bacterium]|nr:FAD-dependent oxidoreductase [Erysipelotrichaceae bacterium]
KKGAEVFCKVRIEKIEGNTVFYLDPKGNPAEVSADRILVAAGRRANIEGLFAESFSVEKARGIIGDECGRTSYGNIFVIGDAKDGNIQLAHVAEAQGLNAIDVIMGREPSIDVSVIPNCVYTSPEIASVGLSERQAREQGIEVTSRKVLTGSNGKSVIEEAESGYVKVVLDKDMRIIGAQMVCPHATELISEMTLLVQQRMTVSQLKQVVHPHPTVAEMIGELSRM